MLDVLQIIFWSITYVLIIISGILSYKEKRMAIPYLAIILNLSWEVCALYKYKGFWGHALWTSLDVVIFILGFLSMKAWKMKFVYVAALGIGVCFSWLLFGIQGGMLYWCFSIDFIMAICYLLEQKNMSLKLKVSIAITKLLGDLFAGIYYATMSWAIGRIAIIVFLCNFIYLYLCVKEKINGRKE